MPETDAQSFSRKARLEDFLDGDDTGTIPRNNYNHNNHHNNNVEKNQQEFGHKKRIKP
jgi:hypothetical protein